MFDTDLTTPLSDERRAEVIDAIARKIVDRRLETPAVLFLDMHKPLSFVASQAMLVGLPFLGIFFGAQPVADVSKLFADPANVEALISRIEQMSAETFRQVQGDKPCHTELDSASSTDPETSLG